MQRCHKHDSSLVMWARPDRFSETNAFNLASGARTLYVACLEGMGKVDIRTRPRRSSTALRADEYRPHRATVPEYRVGQRVTMLGVRLGAERGQGITTVFDAGSDTPPIDRVR